MSLFERLSWCFRCPSTIDSIASHFVDVAIGDHGGKELEFDNAHVDFCEPWFAYRRRIACIYGIADNYRAPDDSAARRGWNRHLWTTHTSQSPEDLVEAVFDQVLERLKSKSSDCSQK